jgi:hypothetical protein
MTRSTVAILRTRPETALRDYHELMNLAGYQAVIAREADTALKVNISWHFFFPGSSTVAARGVSGDESRRLSPDDACHNGRHRRALRRTREQTINRRGTGSERPYKRKWMTSATPSAI